MTAIWMIAFLIAAFGCIPYGIWVIYTVLKKRWKRLMVQVAFPLAVYLLLLGGSAIESIGAEERDARAYKEYLEGLYDAEVDLGDPIFEYRSRRAFNGDGYSISVYELPPAIRTRFESADAKLPSEFPKRPDYRSDWEVELWKRAPYDETYSAQLDFAVTRYHGEPESGLTEQFEQIRKVLSSDEAYYAFFFTGSSDYVGNIDFFIVDLEGGRLYSINHNT